MGLGFLKVFGKSVGKALKKTGITVGMAAIAGAGSVLVDPAAMGAIWAATGPIAPVVVVGLSIAGQALLDLNKHRDKI